MRSTPTPEQQKAWEEKIQAGPFGLLVFNARGGSPLSPAQLVTELASTMLAAAVAAYLASLMVAPMMTRAIAVALLALFASLSIGASYWNCTASRRPSSPPRHLPSSWLAARRPCDRPHRAGRRRAGARASRYEEGGIDRPIGDARRCAGARADHFAGVRGRAVLQGWRPDEPRRSREPDAQRRVPRARRSTWNARRSVYVKRNGDRSYFGMLDRSRDPGGEDSAARSWTRSSRARAPPAVASWTSTS